MFFPLNCSAISSLWGSPNKPLLRLLLFISTVLPFEKQSSRQFEPSSLGGQPYSRPSLLSLARQFDLFPRSVDIHHRHQHPDRPRLLLA
ncbi:hypothetical protein C8R47DRAFT_1159456 [Mycena vitilis]|nr:hypothetical protein C8R47DRAFT_1159456 [Mycena vitilis]